MLSETSEAASAAVTAAATHVGMFFLLQPLLLLLQHCAWQSQWKWRQRCRQRQRRLPVFFAVSSSRLHTVTFAQDRTATASL